MIRIAEEKNFENKIKKYLKDNNCWCVKFFANSFTKKGIPDILACVNGYFVGIEVKASRGTPSELQKYNIAKINESMGIAILLYPKQYGKFVNLIHHLLNSEEMEAFRLCKQINDESRI